MPHQLLSQEIQPSEHTTGEKLILLHTAITSKGCFQIPRMELQLHSSIFTTFLLMKHWKFLLTILIYIVRCFFLSTLIKKKSLHSLEYRLWWELSNFLIIGHIGLKIHKYLKLLIRRLLIALKNLGSIFILLIIIWETLKMTNFSKESQHLM